MIIERGGETSDPSQIEKFEFERSLRITYGRTFLRDHFRGPLGTRVEEVDRLKSGISPWTIRMNQMLNSSIESYHAHSSALDHLSYEDLRLASVSDSYLYQKEEFSEKLAKQMEITDIIMELQEKGSNLLPENSGRKNACDVKSFLRRV